MAEYVVMPKLGFDMREGVLNQWLKSVGEPVIRGEVIAEIESDKATLDLESQQDGTLLHVLENAGAIVPIGAHLAIVGEEGEDFSALLSDQQAGDTDDASAEPATEASRSASAPVTNGTAQKVAVESTEFPAGFRATPVARRVARENGVDLSLVSGSGSDGRIRKVDVEA